MEIAGWAPWIKANELCPVGCTDVQGERATKRAGGGQAPRASCGWFGGCVLGRVLRCSHTELMASGRTCASSVSSWLHFIYVPLINNY